MRLREIITIAIMWLAAASGALAEDRQVDENLYIFGGPYVDAFFEYSLIPGLSENESNFVVGTGYQKFFAEPLTDFHLGLEVGVAARIGDAINGEIWGGVVARYDGLQFGDVRISPAMTFGLSAVTDTLGVERRRAAKRNADPSVLFYLAPEISFSSVNNPNAEIFYRVHHRSGAWGTLGGMADGHNAQVIGFRQKF